MIVGVTQLSAVSVLVLLSLWAAATDIRSLTIPNTVNLAIFVSGLAASFVLPVVGPVSALAGSVAAAAFVLLVQVGFRFYRGYDGLGLGDVKFVGAATTWIGLESIAFALAAASMTALVYVVARRALDPRFDAGRPIPFCPFLAAGFVLVAVAQILTGRSVIDGVDAMLLALVTR
jgi:leader peptidase (prepilin peptidase)/N-methyltransferase